MLCLDIYFLLLFFLLASALAATFLVAADLLFRIKSDALLAIRLLVRMLLHFAIFPPFRVSLYNNAYVNNSTLLHLCYLLNPPSPLS